MRRYLRARHTIPAATPLHAQDVRQFFQIKTFVKVITNKIVAIYVAFANLNVGRKIATASVQNILSLHNFAVKFLNKREILSFLTHKLSKVE